jgi:hypothetical protein
VIRISFTTPAASRLPNRTKSRLTAAQNWTGGNTTIPDPHRTLPQLSTLSSDP